MVKANARFLVVDDSKVARDLVRTALTQMKFTGLDEATNGKAGWEKILRSLEENRPYDMVLCDVNMPEMDGLQLLETIRADNRTKALPVVMITTEGSKPIVIKALMSGVAGYMVKPFGIQDVKNKVQEVFDRIPLVQ